MRIVGIDLSLTATGVAIADAATVTVRTVRSRGAKGDDLLSRGARLELLTSSICGLCRGAALVVVEQPAFSRTTGHHHDRSGLWWLVVAQLQAMGIPVAEVTPSGLKRYVTGRGNADKDTVLLAVARRFGDVGVTNNNEADSLALCAMGADRFGVPLADMPKSHRTSLDAVRWPEVAAGLTPASPPH